MKQSVARLLEKLGLNPVILHEKPDRGRSIIEKFEQEGSNSTFAIILFSPDDIGYSEKDGSESAKHRARQNVIFELGYFVGKLMRGSIVALVNNEKEIEIPNDIDNRFRLTI